jgi:hypothetical protein
VFCCCEFDVLSDGSVEREDDFMCIKVFFINSVLMNVQIISDVFLSNKFQGLKGLKGSIIFDDLSITSPLSITSSLSITSPLSITHPKLLFLT